MPKVTKKLGNNKARAWESLGFAHKKKLCQHFDTTSFSLFSLPAVFFHFSMWYFLFEQSYMQIT
ncbi:hypothetical protein NXW58_05570 [Bacteroides faecis]|uniref:hypothetical protein n=1 Tax=Bacteroides faecis TaxID=674529 RepID=UPI00216542BD|nr:hypothetical protein [Bacteroides faecis]MCS2912867.1 hypothetical protein [Bacteroides faecis]MCS2974212.1 hypothetical protein [Bacteroides faecis]UBE45977.1 hypothetical protein K6V30_03830 [Bacteroides faecis]UVP34428.1 hypothetical protein NXW58_05570 [Bacteroides faecis]